MIEQTEMVVTEWDYHPPTGPNTDDQRIASEVSLQVQKKRRGDKKGIACRFIADFMLGDKPLLGYVAEDSYVIDVADVIDRAELLRMIRNSFSKFKEGYDLRKLSTILRDRELTGLDETQLNLDDILPLLK
jgi:hypothetical protein